LISKQHSRNKIYFIKHPDVSQGVLFSPLDGILTHMEEIRLDTITWSIPEYDHKDRSVDWFWGVGIAVFLAFGIALFTGNYMFGLFILVAGGSLMLFSARPPQNISITIETNGFTMGTESYGWKKVQGFKIKKDNTGAKLIVHIDKKFLPVYTLRLPNELVAQVNENLLKVVPLEEELDESPSMVFMEKIGL
jgi:hypothetical protein